MRDALDTLKILALVPVVLVVGHTWDAAVAVYDVVKVVSVIWTPQVL
jgi:hypothetical protein